MKKGDMAPDFTLTDKEGRSVTPELPETSHDQQHWGTFPLEYGYVCDDGIYAALGPRQLEKDLRRGETDDQRRGPDGLEGQKEQCESAVRFQHGCRGHDAENGPRGADDERLRPEVQDEKEEVPRQNRYAV